MRVEFHRAEAPATVVGTAVWRPGSVAVESDDPSIADTLTRAFRRTPIVVDDAAYRPLGTTGEVVLQPGGLDWFRAVAQVRVPSETGLVARFVPRVREGGGYDPAAGYRSFGDSMERLVRDA